MTCRSSKMHIKTNKCINRGAAKHVVLLFASCSVQSLARLQKGSGQI